MTRGRCERFNEQLARTVVATAVAAVSVAGCGNAQAPAATSETTLPVPAAPDRARLIAQAAPGATAMLGMTGYALDQLAPPPETRPGAPILLAVIRASTTGTATHLHIGGISLVDDRGGRWAPVPIPTYVAIDALENAPIEPSRGTAGTVAFRLPAGRQGVAVSVQASGEEVLLRAAQ